MKVTYEIEYISIFKKPLLVFGAIFSILILLITVKRINMSAFEDDKVKRNWLSKKIFPEIFRDLKIGVFIIMLRYIIIINNW